jgi:hypothetical protein
LEGERSVGERGGEVVEALALDRGEDRAGWGRDGVVTGGNGRPEAGEPEPDSVLA